METIDLPPSLLKPSREQVTIFVNFWLHSEVTITAANTFHFIRQTLRKQRGEKMKHTPS